MGYDFVPKLWGTATKVVDTLLRSTRSCCYVKLESTNMIANCLMRIIERGFGHRKMENPLTIGIYPVHYQPLPILLQASKHFLGAIYIYIFIYLYTNKYIQCISSLKMIL